MKGTSAGTDGRAFLRLAAPEALVQEEFRYVTALHKPAAFLQWPKGIYLHKLPHHRNLQTPPRPRTQAILRATTLGYDGGIPGDT